MCCCARSVQKRLLGNSHWHSHQHGYGHEHLHGHDHKHGHEHDYDQLSYRHDHSDHEHEHDHAHGLEIEVETKDLAIGIDDHAPGRRHLVLSVLGMDCPSCSPRVVRALTSLPSVADCTVDVFAGRATVSYRPDLVLAEHMARKVQSETGFKCNVVEDRILGEVREGLARRRMKMRLGRGIGEKRPDVEGVDVAREEKDGVIEVEYDGNPRDVLEAYAPWDATYVPPAPASGLDSAQREVYRLLKLTIISAVLCIPVLVLTWAPIPPRPTIYGGVSLGLTTLIQGYVARPIYVSGIRALVAQHTIDMDLLVALSTGTAYVFSAVAYSCAVAGKPIQDDGETYFETAALLVTLVMLGRLIAAYARRRTTNAVNGLGAMQVEEATLVLDSEDGTQQTKVIPAGLIHIGDMLRVGPGERVPTDGRVVNGEAHADESAITGESAPVSKRAGSVLVAGTTLLGAQSGTAGSLDMRVTLTPDANTLSRMAELMRAAQGARLRVQDTADRVAGWLAPVVLVLGLITFLGWVGAGISSAKHLSGDAHDFAVRKSVVDAIGYAVAVLIVSCPCAIALCVPMVAVIAVAVGTRRGVLFKVGFSVIRGLNCG